MLTLCHQVFVEKAKGEILGVVIVESGWGSILPTVIIANMMHAGPAERSGRLNIGDQIMSINGTSLVGLPLSTCQSIIKVQSTFVYSAPPAWSMLQNDWKLTGEKIYGRIHNMCVCVFVLAYFLFILAFLLFCCDSSA